MRYRKIALAAAAGSLVAIGFATPSQAALTTLCDGVASDVTVPGDLVVPADKDCELTNVTINGNVTVRAGVTASGTNLLLDNSTVNGNVRVLGNGFAELVGTEVTGATQLVTAYGVYTEDTSLAGNVVANDSGFFYSIGSSHGRNITSNNGETFLDTAWVTRNLITNGDTLTDVYDTVIEGSVSVSGAPDGSVFCLSEVDGDATFSGNGTILQIGASAPLSGCGFNVFGGNLSVTDNTADQLHVADNVVRGDLVCSGNDPLPVVSGNRVRGNVDCESREASSFGTFGVAEDRRAEVKAAAEARAEAASEAAEEAGDAFE